MSPERRKRIVLALNEIWGELVLSGDWEKKTDDELSAMILNLEEMLDRAGGTDVERVDG